MSKIVFEHLCLLNIEIGIQEIRATINMSLVITILSFPAIVVHILDIESHKATHSTYVLVSLHRHKEVMYCKLAWSQSAVHQDTIFRIKEFTESLEEPEMGGKLPSILVLCAKEHVQVVLFFLLFGKLVYFIVPDYVCH